MERPILSCVALVSAFTGIELVGATDPEPKPAILDVYAFGAVGDGDALEVEGDD